MMRNGDLILEITPLTSRPDINRSIPDTKTS
jgi:hypothetical protein